MPNLEAKIRINSQYSVCLLHHKHPLQALQMVCYQGCHLPPGNLRWLHLTHLGIPQLRYEVKCLLVPHQQQLHLAHLPSLGSYDPRGGVLLRSQG